MTTKDTHTFAQIQSNQPLHYSFLLSMSILHQVHLPFSQLQSNMLWRDNITFHSSQCSVCLHSIGVCVCVCVCVCACLKRESPWVRSDLHGMAIVGKSYLSLASNDCIKILTPLLCMWCMFGLFKPCNFHRLNS